jgi:hypothetical protein
MCSLFPWLRQTAKPLLAARCKLIVSHPGTVLRSRIDGGQEAKVETLVKRLSFPVRLFKECPVKKGCGVGPIFKKAPGAPLCRG